MWKRPNWPRSDPTRTDKAARLSDFQTPVSQFLRQSGTYDLARKAQPVTKALYLAPDGNSNCVIGFGSELASDDGQKRLQRMALLQALALAYRKVIYGFAHDLAEQVAKFDLENMNDEAVEELRRLRTEIVRFEAIYLFDNPLMKASVHELAAFWKTCRDSFGIAARMEELRAQSAAAHDLLIGWADRKREKIARKSASGLNVPNGARWNDANANRNASSEWTGDSTGSWGWLAWRWRCSPCSNRPSPGRSLADSSCRMPCAARSRARRPPAPNASPGWAALPWKRPVARTPDMEARA